MGINIKILDDQFRTITDVDIPQAEWESIAYVDYIVLRRDLTVDGSFELEYTPVQVLAMQEIVNHVLAL